MTYASTLMRRMRLLALFACLPLYVQAATPEPVDPATLQLDSRIQALKTEVLDINQHALDAEESFLYPELTRVTVYVGVKTPGLLLNDVTVTIDDGSPTIHTFDTLEAIVLQRRGLQRLLRINAAPGNHRIKASYTGHYADAKPEEPLMTGRYEAVFEKTLEASELELSVAKLSVGARPNLVLRDWRVAP